MEAPIGYRGGVVGLWCHCFCPSIYAYEANGPIGTVDFLVCHTLNHLQEHPYWLPPTPWSRRLWLTGRRVYEHL